MPLCTSHMLLLRKSWTNQLNFICHTSETVIFVFFLLIYHMLKLVKVQALLAIQSLHITYLVFNFILVFSISVKVKKIISHYCLVTGSVILITSRNRKFWRRYCNHGRNILRLFLIFYQIFLSPRVKWSMVINNNNIIHVGKENLKTLWNNNLVPSQYLLKVPEK